MADGAGLLKKIVMGLEESKHVLLEDSVHHNGRPLLVHILYNLAKRYNTVHVVLTDSPVKHWIQYVDISVLKNVEFFNIPLEWSHDQVPAHQKLMDSFPIHNKPETEDNTALVIDNLSTLLLQYNYTEICRAIHILGLHYECTYHLLHWDLHEEHVILGLQYMMSSVIRALPNGGTCSILHKRRSGKILKEAVCYTLATKGNIISQQVKHEDKDKSNTEDFNKVDPTANLTFDLHLTEREKMDRSKVVLPYTQVLIHTANKGSGQILYQLDEVDDWDESDPDDDLDI